jgi:hypothetical protein
MLTATCHCGAVRVEVPHRPDTVADCRCSLCRRYGVLWAYYDPHSVRLLAEPAAIDEYVWGPRVRRFVRCRSCGCVMCWQRIVPVDGSRMGVNARNLEPEALAAARVVVRDAKKH